MLIRAGGVFETVLTSMVTFCGILRGVQTCAVRCLCVPLPHSISPCCFSERLKAAVCFPFGAPLVPVPSLSVSTPVLSVCVPHTPLSDLRLPLVFTHFC